MQYLSYKSFKISIVTLLILCYSSLTAFSQIFGSDQAPPGVKWDQINTNNFQVIYPAEMESEAQRMANTLEHIIKSVSKTLNKTPKRISIILQNQSVVSNGFVQLAPRHSEFFTTPPQNFDFQDWLNSLAVHELRHVVQFDKLAGGLKAPLFEELALAIFGITLPPWFFEGDAVGIETALSQAGRGRLPDWEMIFRTNTLSARSYSYSKNYLGSIKDRTPGYYPLGYFMTTKLRRDYGKYILDSLMTRISKNPLRPYSLSNSIKKYTGMNTRELHDSTIAELSQLWKKQAREVHSLDYTPINRRNDRVPSDYLFPVNTQQAEIIVLKHSLAHSPALIKIDPDGQEQILRRIGFQTEPNFSYSSGILVWDEFRYDIRYQKRSYNVINTFNTTNGKYKQITHKSRLFSPSLSPDGKSIVVVKVSLENISTLVELDTETGEQLKEFSVPKGYSLQTPAFNNEGDKIICVAMSKEGAALIEFNNADKGWRFILPFQHQQFTRPVYAGQNIIFRAHYNGLNNIYSLIPGSSPVQITSAAYGASNPSFHKATNSLLFNNYQVNGYDIVSVSYPPISGKLFGHTENSFINYAAPLVKQEANSAILDSVPMKKYPVNPYTEFKNLFYFHSLSLIAENNEQNDGLNIGLKLKSNNLLNTLNFYAGYQFDYGLKRSEYLAGLTYMRFYPILDLRYINRARLLYTRQTPGNTSALIPVNWRENFMEVEMSVPFTFNKLNRSYRIVFRTSSSYTSRYEIQNKPANFISNLEFPMKYQVYMGRNTNRSARDLAPRWGQNISISYSHLPFEKQLIGSLFSFNSSFYTPGLLNNHSFKASFNYQQYSGAYKFNNEIPKISGYNNLSPVAPLRNTLLLDYRFPLFYPDAEIGPLAYIKRVKGGLFADFENIGKGKTFQPRTYGLELSTDMNLLRFYIPNFELVGKLIFVNGTSHKNPIAEIGFNYNL